MIVRVSQSFNVLRTKLLGLNKTNSKVTPLQTPTSRSFIFYVNKKTISYWKQLDNKQLDFSSIRLFILLMYYNLVFLLSDYSTIYFGWELHGFRCPVLAFPFGLFFQKYFIIFRIKCISTTYIQFSVLVCTTL